MPTVLARSRTFSTKNSSGFAPFSDIWRWLRLNPVAIFCSSVALGSKSPANCSMVNRSNGRFRLRASITQSRHRCMSRSGSRLYPDVSAKRAAAIQGAAIRSP